MNHEKMLAEARHYLAVGRFDKVIERTKQVLANDPQDAQVLIYMGLAELQLDRPKAAREIFAQARQLLPDTAMVHTLYAETLIALQRLNEAQEAVNTARRLDPNDADVYAAQARIELTRQKWDEALIATERGLKIDAEHEDCGNLRSMALTKLRRTDDASNQTLEQLRRDPNNAMAHANRGWQYLHANNPKEALNHFKESLRIEPGNDWAKAGLVEALKARNPIYRILLAYFLWMSTMDTRLRWAVIICGYLVYRAADRLAVTFPEVAMFLWPFIGVYLLFVLLTWVGVPAFNLLLMISPYGRYALPWDDRLTAGVFGGLLVGVITSLGVGWYANIEPLYDMGIMLGLSTLIIVAALQLIGTRKFVSRAVIAGVLVVLMVAVTILEFQGQTELANRAYTVFMLAFIASMWFNVLAGSRTG